MTEIKENIIKNTIINNNIKSAKTNLKRHNIKSFCIRYLKLNIYFQILDIEKNEIHNNKIFPNNSGPIIYKYNGQVY